MPLPELIESLWEDAAVPELAQYIAIPNKSPHFDPGWRERGHMDTAAERFLRYALGRDLAGLEAEIVRLDGRTPLLYIEVPGTGDQTVLLYGHLDKQPEMAGWREGLGPWQPVREGDRLYGRGGADDGYAMFAALGALELLQAQGRPHPRCVVVIEACEESGSYDLPHYMQALRPRIGSPALVICLDSGCGNYEQLWCTTSLRGMVGGNLRVAVLEEGVHSGDAGGVVPSSFRLLRERLSRVEDERSGAVRLEACNAAIPAERVEQARAAAAVLGEDVHGRFPFVAGAGPATGDPLELVLARTWRPALAVTGAEGLPALGDAGNVLRPATAVKLSLRLPPTCDARAAMEALARALEDDPPAGASVRFERGWCADGWNAPVLEPSLDETLQQASQRWFGRPAMYMGEGGTIPFIPMLAREFPATQFLVTGVLGPQSNAHGPNEFLHLPTAKRLTGCVADVIAARCGSGA